MPKLLHKLTIAQILCILVMLASVTVLCISLLNSPDVSSENPAALSQNNNDYTPNDKLSQETRGNAIADIYTIREYKGIIGVFKNDEAEPYITENVQVLTLPPADKAIMAQGVTFDSYKEMIRFLQDYE